MRRRRTMGLSPRDQGVLDIERRWGAGQDSQGAKFAEARHRLGLDPGGYTLVLKALVDDPAAHAHDSETVERLRAVRDGHARATQDLFGLGAR